MTKVDPHVFVIFGGTGDLAQRKLIPSLYRLIRDEGAGDHCVVLGVSRRGGRRRRLPGMGD